MLSAVLHTISRRGLFRPGDRVLVAVSGGPDSMALLAVLWELAPRLGLELQVATVDHGLRREAAAEGELVAERARALGLPWHGLRVEVRSGGGLGGLQEVARRMRLSALLACAESNACTRVALGHQADDQAETVLFRILRGTGLRGLAGIPYVRPPYVRPLLDVPRSRILAYLRRRSLPFVADPSNADPRFARARLRDTLLPALRRENPRVAEALRRLAAEAAALGAPDEGDVGGLEVAARAQGVHVSARLAVDLAEAARKGGTRSFDVAGGRRLTVSYGQLHVSAGLSAPQAPAPEEGARQAVMGAGVHRLGREGVVVVVTDRGAAEDAERAAGLPEVTDWAWFDLGALSWPLVLRRPQPGDRMRPRGGRGSRKVADLFIDAKVPRAERSRRLVVASSDDEILFVSGLRPSRVAAPTPTTSRWLGLATVRE
jgi:tRNA(Ile)-lysidine synthase